MKEIVGARIGNIITNNRQTIIDAVNLNQKVQFLDRRHMELMSACDLGKNWDEMARSKTLFRIDDEGNAVK